MLSSMPVRFSRPVLGTAPARARPSKTPYSSSKNPKSSRKINDRLHFDLDRGYTLDEKLALRERMRSGLQFMEQAGLTGDPPLGSNVSFFAGKAAATPSAVVALPSPSCRPGGSSSSSSSTVPAVFEGSQMVAPDMLTLSEEERHQRLLVAAAEDALLNRVRAALVCRESSLEHKVHVLYQMIARHFRRTSSDCSFTANSRSSDKTKKSAPADAERRKALQQQDARRENALKESILCGPFLELLRHVQTNQVSPTTLTQTTLLVLILRGASKQSADYLETMVAALQDYFPRPARLQGLVGSPPAGIPPIPGGERQLDSVFVQTVLLPALCNYPWLRQSTIAKICQNWVDAVAAAVGATFGDENPSSISAVEDAERQLVSLLDFLSSPALKRRRPYGDMDVRPLFAAVQTAVPTMTLETCISVFFHNVAIVTSGSSVQGSCGSFLDRHVFESLSQQFLYRLPFATELQRRKILLSFAMYKGAYDKLFLGNSEAELQKALGRGSEQALARLSDGKGAAGLMLTAGTSAVAAAAEEQSKRVGETALCPSTSSAHADALVPALPPPTDRLPDLSHPLHSPLVQRCLVRLARQSRPDAASLEELSGPLLALLELNAAKHAVGKQQKQKLADKFARARFGELGGDKFVALLYAFHGIDGLDRGGQRKTTFPISAHFERPFLMGFRKLLPDLGARQLLTCAHLLLPFRGQKGNKWIFARAYEKIVELLEENQNAVEARNVDHDAPLLTPTEQARLLEDLGKLRIGKQNFFFERVLGLTLRQQSLHKFTMPQLIRVLEAAQACRAANCCALLCEAARVRLDASGGKIAPSGATAILEVMANFGIRHAVLADRLVGVVSTVLLAASSSDDFLLKEQGSPGMTAEGFSPQLSARLLRAMSVLELTGERGVESAGKSVADRLVGSCVEGSYLYLESEPATAQVFTEAVFDLPRSQREATLALMESVGPEGGAVHPVVGAPLTETAGRDGIVLSDASGGGLLSAPTTSESTCADELDAVVRQLAADCKISDEELLAAQDSLMSEDAAVVGDRVGFAPVERHDYLVEREQKSCSDALDLSSFPSDPGPPLAENDADLDAISPPTTLAAALRQISSVRTDRADRPSQASLEFGRILSELPLGSALSMLPISSVDVEDGSDFSLGLLAHATAGFAQQHRDADGIFPLDWGHTYLKLGIVVLSEGQYLESEAALGDAGSDAGSVPPHNGEDRFLPSSAEDCYSEDALTRTFVSSDSVYDGGHGCHLVDDSDLGVVLFLKQRLRWRYWRRRGWELFAVRARDLERFLAQEELGRLRDSREGRDLLEAHGIDGVVQVPGMARRDGTQGRAPLSSEQLAEAAESDVNAIKCLILQLQCETAGFARPGESAVVFGNLRAAVLGGLKKQLRARGIRCVDGDLGRPRDVVYTDS